MPHVSVDFSNGKSRKEKMKLSLRGAIATKQSTSVNVAKSKDLGKRNMMDIIAICISLASPFPITEGTMKDRIEEYRNIRSERILCGIC